MATAYSASNGDIVMRMSPAEAQAIYDVSTVVGGVAASSRRGYFTDFKESFYVILGPLVKVKGAGSEKHPDLSGHLVFKNSELGPQKPLDTEKEW